MTTERPAPPLTARVLYRNARRTGATTASFDEWYRNGRCRSESSRGSYVYALCDPRDGQARYVGKSHLPDGRYSMHLRDARQGDGRPVSEWIREILSLGMEPAFTPLRFVPIAEACRIEREVTRSVEASVPLLNRYNVSRGFRVEQKGRG